MSARIANAWIDEFTAQNIARKFDSTTQAREFLEKRLADLREKLEQSERECDNAIALACLIHEGWDFGWREYWSEEIARSEE